MTTLFWIALALGVVALILVLTACARTHIADDLRDEHADVLGIGSDSFPHSRGQ